MDTADEPAVTLPSPPAVQFSNSTDQLPSQSVEPQTATDGVTSDDSIGNNTVAGAYGNTAETVTPTCPHKSPPSISRTGRPLNDTSGQNTKVKPTNTITGQPRSNHRVSDTRTTRSTKSNSRPGRNKKSSPIGPGRDQGLSVEHRPMKVSPSLLGDGPMPKAYPTSWQRPPYKASRPSTGHQGLDAQLPAQEFQHPFHSTAPGRPPPILERLPTSIPLGRHTPLVGKSHQKLKAVSPSIVPLMSLNTQSPLPLPAQQVSATVLSLILHLLPFINPSLL